MTTRAEFCQEVRKLDGTPLQHRGRDPRIGVDCVGLVYAGLAKLGIKLDEPPFSYGLTPSEDQMTQGLQHHADRIAMDLREPGDILQLLVGIQGRHSAVLLRPGDREDLAIQARPQLKRVQQRLVEHTQIVAVWRLRCLHG